MFKLCSEHRDLSKICWNTKIWQQVWLFISVMCIAVKWLCEENICRWSSWMGCRRFLVEEAVTFNGPLVLVGFFGVLNVYYKAEQPFDWVNEATIPLQCLFSVFLLCLQSMYCIKSNIMKETKRLVSLHYSTENKVFSNCVCLSYYQLVKCRRHECLQANGGFIPGRKWETSPLIRSSAILFGDKWFK